MTAAVIAVKTEAVGMFLRLKLIGSREKALVDTPMQKKSCELAYPVCHHLD